MNGAYHCENRNEKIKPWGIEPSQPLGGSYTKQGYATEAVTAFLPVIMKRLGIQEIKGICLADNKASVKVMERCGFTKLYEGVGKYQGEDRQICRFVFQSK